MHLPYENSFLKIYNTIIGCIDNLIKLHFEVFTSIMFEGEVLLISNYDTFRGNHELHSKLFN